MVEIFGIFGGLRPICQSLSTNNFYPSYSAAKGIQSTNVLSTKILIGMAAIRQSILLPKFYAIQYIIKIIIVIKWIQLRMCDRVVVTSVFCNFVKCTMANVFIHSSCSLHIHSQGTLFNICGTKYT